MFGVYYYNNNVHSYLSVKDENSGETKLFARQSDAENQAKFVRTNFSSKVYVAELGLPVDKIRANCDIHQQLNVVKELG
jgi:hypothetical protein